MRIGLGYDAHKLIPGKGMVLGGIFIESSFSIEAHSDGDVIIHSLIDSLLGASALGNKGSLFPSSKSEYKDISSRKLLKEVVLLLNSRKFKIINVDITLIAQEPNLKTFIDTIRGNLSEDLKIGIDFISCKATTTDGLGFEGLKKGISCIAMSLIEEKI